MSSINKIQTNLLISMPDRKYKGNELQFKNHMKRPRVDYLFHIASLLLRVCEAHSLLITARKRSLRRLCVHRCLSVRRGVLVSVKGGHVWHVSTCMNDNQIYIVQENNLFFSHVLWDWNLSDAALCCKVLAKYACFQ